MTLRRSLVTPPPGVEVGPDLLRLAVMELEGPSDPGLSRAHQKVKRARAQGRAAALVRALDWTAFEWFWVEGGLEWERRHDRSCLAGPRAAKAPGAPSAAVCLSVAQRDGWTCRYCGLRVVSPATLRALANLLPAVLPLGRRTIEMHPAYDVLRCTWDHVVPHAAGGDNDAANLVASCGTCNFNKGNCSLAELGLIDPRDIVPVQGDWDGLSGRLGSKAP